MVKTKEELLKEKKALYKRKKYIQNALFNFRSKCWNKMVVVDSELFLPNEEFNALFEKLIGKLSPEKLFDKLKGEGSKISSRGEK